MNKFEPTTETIKKPETQEYHEIPKSVENPEQLRQQILSEAEKETNHFKKECADDLAQVETRAEKDGLSIDNADKEELQGLNKEVNDAKSELTAEVEDRKIETAQKSEESKENIKTKKVCPKCGKEGGEAHSFCGECGEKLEAIQIKVCAGCGKENKMGSKFCEECGGKFEKLESEEEKANIMEVVKDKNFEGSIIVKTEDAEGRIVGYALRKNSKGGLEGNQIGYMKDGSTGWVQQLHESDFAKLGKNGVMEKYETALIDENNSKIIKSGMEKIHSLFSAGQGQSQEYLELSNLLIKQEDGQNTWKSSQEVDVKFVEEALKKISQKETFEAGKEKILKLHAEWKNDSQEYQELYSSMTKSVNGQVVWKDMDEIDLEKVGNAIKAINVSKESAEVNDESTQMEAVISESDENRAENIDEKKASVEKRLDSRFKESFSDALKFENIDNKENLEGGFLEKMSFLADGKSIENQQIDVIKNQDGSYRLNFKLTESAYENVANRFKNVECNSTISYDSSDGNRKIDLVNCWEEKVDGMVVKISSGERKNLTGKVRCSLGMVEIYIENDEANESMDDKKIATAVDKYFKENLGIESGVDSPGEMEDKNYKAARYMWSQKMDSLPENFKEIEKNLKRQEIFPGYSTIIEEGKHREYQEVSPYAVFHKIYNIEHLPTIINAGGLIATHERIKRGIAINGKSSATDIETGGGDSVFTRIITKDGAEKNNPDLSKGDVYFLFDNDILDRTDWYAYEGDRYGSTGQDTFSSRQSPKQIFEDQKKRGFHGGNEQMFRTGISVDKVKTIACSDVFTMKKVYRSLLRKEISEINGVPIEELLAVKKSMADLIPSSEINAARDNSHVEILKQYKENMGEIASLENEREQNIVSVKNKFDSEIKSILTEKKNRLGSIESTEQLDEHLNSEAADLYKKVMNAVIETKDTERKIEEINQRLKSLDEDADGKSLMNVVNFEFIAEELKNGTELEVATGEKFAEIINSLEGVYADAMEKNPSMNFLDIIDLIENDLKKYY